MENETKSRIEQAELTKEEIKELKEEKVEPKEELKEEKTTKKKGIPSIIKIMCTLFYIPASFIMAILTIEIAEALTDFNYMLWPVLTGVAMPYLLLFLGVKKGLSILSNIAIIVEGVVIALFALLCIYLIPEINDSLWQNQWKKPIIYIYPKEEINVEIKVSNPKKLTVSYPKYNDGWKVKALTDGTLIDQNNKKYYALYWEGKGKDDKIKEDGFIIKGEDTSSFLEEKLEILGLNYKERNEFIMYWLPKLEKNKYNYIRFMTKEEIDNNMELIINPKPDTLIRVMMEYKRLDKKIKVKEQNLIPVKREGYTIIEWGGTEIKR